jgi:hypothetical protein
MSKLLERILELSGIQEAYYSHPEYGKFQVVGDSSEDKINMFAKKFKVSPSEFKLLKSKKSDLKNFLNLTELINSSNKLILESIENLVNKPQKKEIISDYIKKNIIPGLLKSRNKEDSKYIFDPNKKDKASTKGGMVEKVPSSWYHEEGLEPEEKSVKYREIKEKKIYDLYYYFKISKVTISPHFDYRIFGLKDMDYSIIKDKEEKYIEDLTEKEKRFNKTTIYDRVFYFKATFPRFMRRIATFCMLNNKEYLGSFTAIMQLKDYDIVYMVEINKNIKTEENKVQLVNFFPDKKNVSLSNTTIISV